ncbi:Rapamycin-insensitive companion of mTOR [Portunus trituberculatus]|uniref:Rapamycin-insensitive companion of mTOR n=2 Tax=Portunus trituberculatus TaxID=210409 RepID=A0A5B7DSM7_PORTR|nr:Rapamycin-insensitive companion of mTOR [Portunus trituberculatus]
MSNLLDVQGLVRSPSGCSEVSSVRSGVRGIGLGPSSSSRALGSYNLIGATQHQAGQCYIGFALPLDLDLLLYDASMDKNVGQGEAGQTAATNTPGKDRFPAITESELETQSEEDPDKKKAGTPKKKTDDAKTSKMIHGNGLELHSPHTCLACYTLTPPTPPPTPKAAGEGDGEAPEAEVVVVSPPLQRVKAISEASEASDPSSVNSQGWEDSGEVKYGPDRVNQVLFRKEVLRFITNLLSSIAAKSSEAGLLTLKQRWPGGFKDVCLYAEICQILASYNYRLTARRFIQELFMDMVFTEVYNEASRILKQQFEDLCETTNPVVQEMPAKIVSSLQPPTMADIAEVTLSDKSDREEDC